MIKSRKALVFLFNGYGYEPSDELVSILAREISKRTDAKDTVKAFFLDEKDIAKSIVSAIKTTEGRVESPIAEEMTYNPEEYAVILIGNVMKDSLTENYKPETFIAHLMKKMADARMAPNDEENKKFINALFILSREDLVISKSLLRKYRLNETKIGLIKYVFNLMK